MKNVNIEEVATQDLADVQGGAKSAIPFPYPGDNDVKPSPIIRPPVAYTQALGEDGGSLPEPDLL
ncbi:hypothetical protein [Alteromonas oceanisediminis]|uniref:hypothetical protein n=1 Tax=Alteromonas oceanisediminis TaxID=2836180 RepID=UPI001BDAA48D|nr:hypothetical protein [Alteromonas oceanisediminis]MBT0587716.1 hypothetical protein [Alteromonas oceanisediminis]